MKNLNERTETIVVTREWTPDSQLQMYFNSTVLGQQKTVAIAKRWHGMRSFHLFNDISSSGMICIVKLTNKTVSA
jgi:hypothetical protein